MNYVWVSLYITTPANSIMIGSISAHSSMSPIVYIYPVTTARKKLPAKNTFLKSCFFMTMRYRIKRTIIKIEKRAPADKSFTATIIAGIVFAAVMLVRLYIRSST